MNNYFDKNFSSKNKIIKQALKANFFIKEKYISRSKPKYYYEDIEAIWQPRVYSLADYLGEQIKAQYIIAIGCGSATKLIKMHPKFKIIGIDIGKYIQISQKQYPFGSWIEHDLESPSMIPISDNIISHSIIICADVIEHLANPSYLLWNLKKIIDLAPVCLLSTPERDLVRGHHDFGPPENKSHVREWNMEELTQLLHHFKLNLHFIGLTVNNNKELKKETTLAVIRNKRMNGNDKESKIFSELLQAIEKMT